jgi:hypothetical protein
MHTDLSLGKTGNERRHVATPGSALPGKSCGHCWSFAPGRGDCTGKCLSDETFSPAAGVTADAVFLP